MNAAMQLGIEIPKLCATDSLEAFGSCRLCLCEIEGRNGTPASCTTPVAPGIKVTTQNARLANIRRGVMELYISDHPLDCLTCAANGDCELQDMAGAVGLREVRYGYDGENHVFAKSADGTANDQFKPKDTSNPYFQFEPSKCIVCSRCVRACEEVQGTFALTIDGRGFASHVSASMDESFLASECVSCGACVQACPTATLIEKSVVDMGQPEHSIVTTCAYCGVGCSFKAEMRGEEVVAHGALQGWWRQRGPLMRQGPLRVRLCDTQGPHLDTDDPREDHRSLAGRLVGRGDQLRRQAAQGNAAKYGRTSIGGITSSRTTKEEVYVVQRMVRAAFNNNNVDTCARVCHSPTGYGLKQTFGESAGTQDFKSVDKTDVMLVIGANPTDAHPVFASRMKKRLREGAKLIVDRSAPHRPRALAACQGGLSPATSALDQRRDYERVRPRDRDREPDRPQVRQPALRAGRFLPLGRVHQTAGTFSRGRRADHRRSGAAGARGGPPLRDRRQRRDLLRSRRHRAYARARRWSWRWPTSRWRPAISAAKASA